jgi:hypothetical protein
MTIRKFYPPWLTFSRPIQTRRQRLLSDPMVIQLIREAMTAAVWGESPDTFIRSMKK